MRAVLFLAMTVALLGCAVEATEDSAAAPAGDPSVQGAQGAQGALTGKVLETMDVSTYTYVRLETPSGEAWAAIPQAQLAVGAEVAIQNPQAMENFESKTLQRTFDTIYFGTLAAQGPSSPMGGSNPHGSLSPGAGGHGQAPATPIAVDRAEGSAGRTIAELYAQRSALAGQTIALRGKVVKYSANIMGRNWIHLQDGTGDGSAGTHDVTVTSSDPAAVGDVILVQGTVVVDKDFGAGYRYDVIVEDATVR